MGDVAAINAENAHLRKIQTQLLQWDAAENPLAPLTDFQKEAISNLSRCMENNLSVESPDKVDEIQEFPTNDTVPEDLSIDDYLETNNVESMQQFLVISQSVTKSILNRDESIYTDYLDQLDNRTEECDRLLEQIDTAVSTLKTLTTQYNFVAKKTSSLHTACEQLLSEQAKMEDVRTDIGKRLQHFSKIEQLTQTLQNPTLAVPSELFTQCIHRIDECLNYLNSNPKYKDANVYIGRYRECLAKAISMLKKHVIQVLQNATEQIMAPQKNGVELSKLDQISDTAFALYYGKFQASAPKVKLLMKMVEDRVDFCPEYEQLLSEIVQCYLSQRAMIMSPGVESAIKDLTNSTRGDHCALVRCSCAFLVHVCQDEHRLFYQFFCNPSPQLNSYMEGLCTLLYDILRPCIIHINHLETLAEICSILRIEMLEEHCQNNAEILESFANVVHQLLQDVQERLVFRAHIYFQTDILNYKPSPGDLAYPEKLEMMESIALSLQEPLLRRSDSRASVISISSMMTQDEDRSIQETKTLTPNSPADLHGMWYPPVRRTLVCLSRLYRCVDRPIFQGLSQEALTNCVQSVSTAANAISTSKTVVDAELFQIKHLLILREQIAPFRVDFTVKETCLDFSKCKTAAFGLLQKRKNLFSMSSNNALLEFLLEGTPQVKEQLLDSRKDVDRQLKYICEMFIRDATSLMVGNLIAFIEKANTLNNSQAKPNFTMRQSAWASPQQISSIIQESQRSIKAKLAGLQRSMQLYLANRDTEFILFRPIRNKIIGAFVKVEQILISNNYSKDDLTIVSCPSAEQMSVLLSNAVMVENARKEIVPTVAATSNVSRKPSTTSIVEKEQEQELEQEHKHEPKHEQDQEQKKENTI